MEGYTGVSSPSLSSLASSGAGHGHLQALLDASVRVRASTKAG